MRFCSKLCVILSAIVFVGCSVTPPKDVRVVDNFDSQRYMGTWYEVARLDHRFERGLEQVTANYSPRADGGLKVLNRGFDSKKQQWKESEGKAYFIGSPQIASLKVSFFGPFYGGYNVIDLDTEYRYALVAGPSKDYLWILSRTPTLDTATRDRLIQIAKGYGFDTAALIWVNQKPVQ
ncbi:outer membrane lipoprotein Blc [Serratia sp. UGAL515B_01]|uniref:outer membrane lipoprotein Blc n=1 Tax=Serratia sp. UGAL515B_01 TaxID=2986763 RepID=UPI002952F202|nr:outer membrane lipoprotein Blc [Serratia sp. UGAL515B_01]WON77260.1 outer membrane lipoprotein Blc [Serratia sp. UGAL515B_01]